MQNLIIFTMLLKKSTFLTPFISTIMVIKRMFLFLMDELNFVHSFFLQSKEGATIIIYNFTQTFIWQLVYWAEIDYKIYDGGNCYFVSSIHWPIHYMSNCKKILNQYMNNPCYFVKIDWINIKINMFSPDNGFFSATLW